MQASLHGRLSTKSGQVVEINICKTAILRYSKATRRTRVRIWLHIVRLAIRLNRLWPESLAITCQKLLQWPLCEASPAGAIHYGQAKGHVGESYRLQPWTSCRPCSPANPSCVAARTTRLAAKTKGMTGQFFLGQERWRQTRFRNTVSLCLHKACVAHLWTLV